MAKEIERKFLVKSLEWKEQTEGILYRQGYLNSLKERTVQMCHGEADHDGDGGGEEVNAHRLHADAPQGVGVAEAGHAHHQGGEHHRNDHHLDEVDEDGADGCDPPFDKGQPLRPSDEAEDDGGHQGDEDFNR